MNKIQKLYLTNIKIMFKEMIGSDQRPTLSLLKKVIFQASKLINKLYKL